jgi:hypothetical protein
MCMLSNIHTYIISGCLVWQCNGIWNAASKIDRAVRVMDKDRSGTIELVEMAAYIQRRREYLDERNKDDIIEPPPPRTDLWRAGENSNPAIAFDASAASRPGSRAAAYRAGAMPTHTRTLTRRPFPALCAAALPCPALLLCVAIACTAHLMRAPDACADLVCVCLWFVCL